MTEYKPDIRAIMAEIREQAKQNAGSIAGENKVAPYQPLRRTPPSPEIRPTIYSDELNYINAHWNDWFEQAPPPSHRRILGRIVTTVKSKVRNIVRSVIFPDYFENQQQFLAQLVRHLNDNARYIDTRIHQTFWESMHKVDQDISGVNARCDRAIDEVMVRTDHRLNKLEARIDSFDQKNTGNGGEPPVRRKIGG